MQTVKSAVLASIYAGFGALILVLTNFLWSNGWEKMGMVVVFQTPLLEALLFGLLGLGLITVVMSLIVSVLINKEKSYFLISVIAAFLTLSSYYLTAVATLISKYNVEQAFMGSFWALIFGFLNGGIVGCSIYLHLMLQERNQILATESDLEIESLKLEHKWFLTVFTSTSYAIMIFVVSAVVVSWTQMILPQIPQDMANSTGLFYLFMVTVVQLIYMGVGLWMGVVGKLLGYSLRVHNRMRELKIPKKKEPMTKTDV